MAGANRKMEAFVVLAALAIALASAQDFAGCWNDGSRLATVEALADHGTLAIDRSIFVDVHQDNISPYPESDDYLQANGTGDKLLVTGRYYSDKSPVPALLLAGFYKVLQLTTGLVAKQEPHAFCYALTVLSSGAMYVLAVWCIFRIAGIIGLSPAWQLFLTASFALATVALTYVRHVNNHMLLLGITSAVFLMVCRAHEAGSGGMTKWKNLMLLGNLIGFGYTIDLGIGPVLVVGVTSWVACVTRRWTSTAILLLAAFPWFVVHQWLNYAIGGTFRPANAVPEYLAWPGSSFDSENMTGAWHHHNLGRFLLYAAALVFGKRGFFGHNLALYLFIPALVRLLRRQPSWRGPILLAGAFSAGSWLLYAATSNNSSGLCCSIRWFVPLLAPGYLVLGLWLRDSLAARKCFIILSAWGTIMAALMWSKGPWMQHVVPWYWQLQGLAVLSLGIMAWRAGKLKVAPMAVIDSTRDGPSATECPAKDAA